MSTSKHHNLAARTYRVKGRVQGVGFRYFVKHNADALGVRGYVRNEDNGDVLVYAVGDPISLERLAGAIHTGPRFSDVRSVAVAEAAEMKYESFRIEH